jgi:hypothetical protein
VAGATQASADQLRTLRLQLFCDRQGASDCSFGITVIKILRSLSAASIVLPISLRVDDPQIQSSPGLQETRRYVGRFGLRGDSTAWIRTGLPRRSHSQQSEANIASPAAPRESKARMSAAPQFGNLFATVMPETPINKTGRMESPPILLGGNRTRTVATASST